MAYTPLTSTLNATQVVGVDYAKQQVVLQKELSKRRLGSAVEVAKNPFKQPTPEPFIYDDPELDQEAFLSNEDTGTAVGQVVNIGGAFVSGAATVQDAAMSLPARATEVGQAIVRPLDQAFKEAAPDLYGFLNRSIGGANPFIKAASKGVKDAFGQLDVAGDIVSDFGSRFHNDTAMQETGAELGEAWDESEGAIDTVMNMGAVIADNPVTALETVSQSIPQMMALAQQGDKLAMAFMAMTGDRVDEANAEYAKTHDGAQPEGVDQVTALGAAALATAIEVVESKFVLNKFGKLPAPVEAAAKAVGAKLAIPGVKTVTKGLASGGAEVFQESSAQYLTKVGGQQTVESLTDPEVLKETAVAGAQGFGAGVVMGGGAQAISDTAKVAGKVSKAVSGEEIPTPTEFTPEQAKSFEDSGAALIQAFADVDPAKKDKSTLKNVFTTLREYGDKVTDIENVAQREKAEASLAKYKAKITDLVGEFNKNKPAKVAETVVKATAPTATPKTTAEATAEMVEIVKGDPTVDGKAASDILGSKYFEDAVKEGVITKEQVKVLEDHVEFSKSLSQVSKEMVEGGDGNVGINQYVESASIALAIGDTESLIQITTALEKWGTTQAEKLKQAKLHKSTNGEQGIGPKGGGTHTDGYIALVEKDLVTLRKTYAHIAGLRDSLTGAQTEAVVESIVEPIPEVAPTGEAKKPTTPKAKSKPVPVPPKVATVTDKTPAETMLEEVTALPTQNKRVKGIASSLRKAIKEKKNLSPKTISIVEAAIKEQGAPTPKVEPKVEAAKLPKVDALLAKDFGSLTQTEQKDTLLELSDLIEKGGKDVDTTAYSGSLVELTKQYNKDKKEYNSLIKSLKEVRWTTKYGKNKVIERKPDLELKQADRRMDALEQIWKECIA